MIVMTGGELWMLGATAVELVVVVADATVTVDLKLEVNVETVVKVLVKVLLPDVMILLAGQVVV